MWTEIHWINGPWPGRVAVSSRPRGGEWLVDEVNAWKTANIDAVLSLLTPEEQKALDIESEKKIVTSKGMSFLSLPIADRQVPGSESELVAALESVDRLLSDGKNVLVHCRQGIGRTGLVTACLLISKGISAGNALDAVRQARGVDIPETPEQQEWVYHFASATAGAK